MRYYKSIVMLVLLACCLTAKAGVAALTHHSRANCAGFNESISWRLGYSYLLRTYSEHFRNIDDDLPAHTLDTGQQRTWRSAAVHATEGYGGWYVRGSHLIHDGRDWTEIRTWATDCKIYDGWWDH